MRVQFWQVGLISSVSILLGCSRQASSPSGEAVPTRPVAARSAATADNPVAVALPVSPTMPRGAGLPVPGNDHGPDLPALRQHATMRPPVPPPPPAALRPDLQAAPPLTAPAFGARPAAPVQIPAPLSPNPS